MKIPEKFLHLVWYHLLFDTQNLKTTENEPLQIIKKGKYNIQGQGPDFTEAIVNIENIVWNGSIEIETHSKNWYLHQHHLNSEFNNVILLVVYEHDEKTIIKNNNGMLIPILVIKPKIFKDAIQKLEILTQYEFPCHSFLNHVPQYLQKITLTQLAIERLEEKVKFYFNEDLETMSWQMLWTAYGSPYHSNFFKEISEKITPKIFFECNEPIEKEALVFGVAGFLQGNRKCDYFNELKNYWNHFKVKYQLNELTLRYFNLKTRVHSYPHLLMAELVAWLHKNGNSLINPKIEHFENLGEVSFYWKEHIFFEQKSTVKTSFGKQKQLRLMLNWLFPFQWYYYKNYQSEKLSELIEEYSKSLKEENQIIRNMEKWGWKIHNGMETQGAIQLYKKYCLEKKCLDCNIGKWILNTNNEPKHREKCYKFAK